MAFTSRPITVNESTAGLRTIMFAVFNTEDGTAKTDLSAATALIHTNGGSSTDSTNNFVHRSNGRYALELTQSEVNLAPYSHLTIGPANASGYYVSPAEVVITAAAVSADVISISGDSAAADNLEAAFDGTGYAGGTIKAQVNTVQINSAAVTGNGTSGNKWRG